VECRELRVVLSLCLAFALASSARAASFQEVEGLLALSVGSASSCSGPGECIGVEVSLAPGAAPADTILFDLHAAWDPAYWSLREIVGAGAVQRDDTRGYIDDLFADVGAGAPILAGEGLVTLVFEVVGIAGTAALLEIGDLSARDPFFDRAVLLADSEFTVYPPTPNSLLLVPEPGTGLLLGVGLGALRLRRRRAVIASAAALAALACGDGGRVPAQRTFVWHGGTANESPFSASDANPFRGRVAPTKPLRISIAPNPDFGSADPEAIRFHEGDVAVNPAALTSLLAPLESTQVDVLDPAMAQVVNAPADVLLDLRGWPSTGGMSPASLSSTFPGRFTFSPLTATGLSANANLTDDFGGDFLGDITPCMDPTSDFAAGVAAGLQPADPLARCIESSSAPGQPDGSYTQPGLVAMGGGLSRVVTGPLRVDVLQAYAGETPFRPGPDLGNAGSRILMREAGGALVLGALAPSDGTHAQGTFVPSRGMRVGQPMHYERNVDPATGRPLVARLDLEPIGTCAAAGESAPDLLNSSGLAYNSAFASHPFSVTPGAPDIDGLSVVNRRGGAGTDPGCLRPGGAPGAPNAFAFDLASLADTDALENHHANQGMFAALCRATLPFEVVLDPGACLFNVFGSQNSIQLQLLPQALVESLTPILAGEQTGSGGPLTIFGLIANNQKGPIAGAQLPPVPLAGLNQLFNDPDAPFDGTPGGYDGFDGRVQLPSRQGNVVLNAVVPFVTLDKALTNEQRALGGCGPFYASRCDSSLPYRDSAKGIAWGGFGGLDLLNGEASALLESVRAQGAEGSATGTAAQPGTVGFGGPPVCMRRLQNGTLVRLPGCRGVQALEVADVSGSPVVRVEFEGGYRPSIDGCVIGTHINRPGLAAVPVELVGGSAGDADLLAELTRCNTAIVRRAVPNRLIVRDTSGVPVVNPDGTPVTLTNPACAVGQPQVGPISPAGLRLCIAQSVTLADLPLIHPTAGCVDSDVAFQFTGVTPDDCRYWAHRDLVAELLVGKAQLFRSETAALSWNLTAFLAVTSCDVRTKDAEGNDHSESSGPHSLEGDPQCFYPPAAYDASRCSLAAPQLCKNVRGVLGMAPQQPEDGSWPDLDGDGVTDDGDGSGSAVDATCLTGEVLACDDNCADMANTLQVNSNGFAGPEQDPFGNVCDPDLDDDGVVDENDRQLQLACFQSGSPPPACADADLVGRSGVGDPDPDALRVDGFDRLQLLRWLRNPGSVPGSSPD
jgi:hypothetical protein